MDSLEEREEPPWKENRKYTLDYEQPPPGPDPTLPMHVSKDTGFNETAKSLGCEVSSFHESDPKLNLLPRVLSRYIVKCTRVQYGLSSTQKEYR